MPKRKLIDDSGELQEPLAKYLERVGWDWNSADVLKKEVSTERVDWVASLKEKPERINSVAMDVIKIEWEELWENLEDGDIGKIKLRISNLRKLIDILERGVKRLK